ncbi:glycoside hydrolase family 3 N-terminal domain-containing protein [Saccharomonospora cyanea]|uniref:beta-N-acetylhexosaminidase n=1 Tax=Saccharomonospora cyanea NA-134 TaxID=882082 RepID=H5XD79_9PSEU|nr:glycoside hydrolase family 3 N-terminal domain-containing protein [Saccharomonospora cyanea]EHR59159.1 beta-glucosidase-like glycosyl hydrolase [Saccharomonospora cyanea NA-134]
MKRTVLAAACVAALATAACGGDDQAGDGDGASPRPGPTGTQQASPRPSPSATQPPGGECASVIEGLSPRERAAQLLVVGVEPSDPASTVALVRDNQVGGIFIGGNATEVFTGDALEQVQQAADLPVSVAVDDEGGRVQRIDELVGSIPSAREMAATMTPEQVRELAAERGRQLRELGVTVDYAPVVDLTDGPAGGVIGDRSFSADPQEATEYAAAFAGGLSEAGVHPVIKHFPGHGRASGDSHQGLVQTPPLEDLRQTDLVPYEDLGVYPDDTEVMVGHLAVPGLTEGQPASLSPAAYRLLREDYGYDGVVLTDDLGAMRAISDNYTLDEAVLIALKAGADQPLWSAGGDVGPVLDRLEAAMADGELPQERVNDALTRVLTAKGACG